MLYVVTIDGIHGHEQSLVATPLYNLTPYYVARVSIIGFRSYRIIIALRVTSAGSIAIIFEFNRHNPIVHIIKCYALYMPLMV